MILPFNHYINEHLVRVTKPNISMAKDMIEKADIRLRRLSKGSIDEEESSIVFEDVYESLREAAQALMELHGYKPYSHEALISFLKETKMLPEAKISILDGYRVVRNNSIYKAEKVSLQKCLESIDFAKSTLPEIKRKFEELVSL